jgi:hypothetical protein
LLNRCHCGREIGPPLKPFNPGDKEVFHAVSIGGANMPARIRVIVDYLVERMSQSPGETSTGRPF